MLDLPEPKPTATAAGQATPTQVDRDNIRRLFAALDEIGTDKPAAVRVDDESIPSFEDGPRVGDTPPVLQPDSRIVPAWALGIAVGSIGVGAGSVGLGCAVWLACKGLSSVIHSLSTVTLAGVLTVAIPFAGLAMVVTAVGGAIGKAKRAVVPDVHHHNGPEYHEHHTTNTRAVWVKNINQR
jgi:hypothetical protein